MALGQTQSNAADIQGFVRDSTGAVVANATVTVRNPGTNLSRTTTSNDEGNYRIVNLPPGDYEITVEASNFKKAVLTRLALTVGQSADVDITLEPGQISESVTISDATSEIVETTKTAVATTVDQQRINNLPINERNYLAFALTTSTVGRDNGRPIGPAPTTGLNFGGQRGRSNLVQVDGADNTDNSVNASRSTVSQEAVQEFQVVTNSFAPEFGRSSGGIVNVVTKSGTNEVRGNVFGFLRDKSFQARNPFAPIEKPDFRRTQYGVTLGGPLDRDRTFFFFAFEQRRRDESGFFTSNVAQGLGGSVTIGAPFLPFTQTFSNITGPQASYVTGLLGTAATLIGVRRSGKYRPGYGNRDCRYSIRRAGIKRRRHCSHGHESSAQRWRRDTGGHGNRAAVLFDRRSGSCFRHRFSTAEQLVENFPGQRPNYLQLFPPGPSHHQQSSDESTPWLQPKRDQRHSGGVTEPVTGPERFFAHRYSKAARFFSGDKFDFYLVQHSGQ